MPRIFAAIPIDTGIAEALQPLMKGLHGVRWTPPERLHVTLRFAGEMPETSVAQLGEALAQVRAAPVQVALEGAGSFELGHGRGVLWAGVRPDAGLAELQSHCEAAARLAGLPPDEREWLPHVTVGYMNHYSPAAAAWGRRHQSLRTGPMEASAFGLYESVRTGGDLQYRLVQSYRLGA